ncbi:MAG: WHG domain-containing protein [Alphaproteobacteria bacterium]
MVSEPKAVARRRKLRDALIQEAERTIEKEGLRGMKARELAYKVGCAVGAIYNVFTDLDDLIFAVNALTLEQLETTLTVAGEKTTDPQASAIRTLAHLALAYTDYAAANRRRWRALFDHRLAEDQAVPAWYQAQLARLFVYIEEPLRSLAPAMDPKERMQLARSLFSAVHGIVLIGLEEKLQSIPLSAVRAQVTFMVEAFAKGLAHK